MDNRTLIEEYYTMWNEQDFSKAEKIFDPDIRFRGSLGIQANGLEGFRDYAQMIFNAFTSLYHAVEIMVVEDDKAAVYVSYTGRHEGEIMGYKATGKRISYRGAAFFHFRNGKIYSINVLGDLNALESQLAIP